MLLEDLDGGQQIYMRTVTDYTFTSPEGGGVRHLRIVAYDDTTSSLALTSVSVRAMPASGGATITYSVSKPAAVTIDICNISGVVIRYLGQRSSATSQVETVVWDGRDTRGTKVLSGRYLTCISARASDGQIVQTVRPVCLLP